MNHNSQQISNEKGSIRAYNSWSQSKLTFVETVLNIKYHNYEVEKVGTWFYPSVHWFFIHLWHLSTNEHVKKYSEIISV